MITEAKYMNTMFSWSKSALKDFEYWKRNDKKKTAKIEEILTDILKTPYHGIGKPEPLRFNLSGCRSRRIDRENRFLYKIKNVENEIHIEIISCRSHYKK